MGGRPAAVRDRQAFEALLRSRRQAKSGPVKVHFVEAPEPEAGVEVAYAVGRKIGSAVVRNRWRRRLRAVAAEVSPELPPGRYLVRVGPEVERLTFGELRERVSETMRRASGAGR